THDLTSPFSNIEGYCDIMLNDVRKGNYANVLRFSEIIYESSIRATDLLRNLRQWSKIQTNQIRLTLTKVRLSSLIEDSIQQVKVSADRKNIVIQKDAPDDLVACMDKQMIETVLRNLITNAVKFSNPGGRIHISVVKNPEDVTVSVSDNGIGMKKEILDDIFSPESKSMTGTMSEIGSGLGLKLCKEFVELHGGTIRAGSIEGQGSSFTFNIPDAVC
ncbi:MAG TPA: HAMP domain-containing sensor histidine kinase, partial [Bacteroidales bacterium]|nr:HAMP domain-containing sensor histidine kinase [Bacteroidales bacterium]